MDQTPIDNRKSERSHLFMKASLDVAGRTRDVRLRNLSELGALVEGDDLPAEGSELLFKREGLSVPGRVAWTGNGRAGIAFAQSLQPDVVLRHVPQPRVRQQVASRRPGVRASALSEGERRFVEQWIYGNGNTPRP